MHIKTTAMNRIPHQLQNSRFRFVLIRRKDKRPFERDWNVPGSQTNYDLNSPKFLAYLELGYNYGICCGFGGMVVVDVDEYDRLKELGIIDQLPNTFTAQTGNGGFHLYYTCNDVLSKTVMYDKTLLDDDGGPLHLGEIQAAGVQCVCPGSTHPNGKKYVVTNDVPITHIKSEQVILDVIGNKARIGSKPDTTSGRPRQRITQTRCRSDPFDAIKVSDILYPLNAKIVGDDIIGANPVHGSKGGRNFVIHTDTNTWRCWRCNSYGGPALAIAVRDGIMQCDQARAGALQGEDFMRVVEIAEREGRIKTRRPTIKLGGTTCQPTHSRLVTHD